MPPQEGSTNEIAEFGILWKRAGPAGIAPAQGRTRRQFFVDEFQGTFCGIHTVCQT
jgi:hypothetical protein